MDDLQEEAVRELRADIGAAMLMEELAVPHSISFSNFYKWKSYWLALMKSNENLIFKVCASAAAAVKHILEFTIQPLPLFNCIHESMA